MASSAVQALAGASPNTRVFGEILPEKFDPTSNAGIVVSIKAGSGHPEISPVVHVDIQVTCWAGVNQFLLARTLYGAVYDTMHGKNLVTFTGYGTVVSSVEMTQGQSVVDPDTRWATIVGAFHMIVRQDGASTLPTWVDGGVLGSHLTRYNFTPAPDGVTVTFTAPVAISVDAIVIRNGMILTAGDDYSYSGTQVTFFVAPGSSDVLVLYQ